LTGRPAEVDVLQGNASKAKQKLGWEPTIGFEDMICEMVDADLRRLGGRPRLPKALQPQRRGPVEKPTRPLALPVRAVHG